MKIKAFTSAKKSVAANNQVVILVPYKIPDGCNRVIFGMVSSTGSPFCYAYVVNPFKTMTADGDVEVHIHNVSENPMTTEVTVYVMFD